MSPAVELRDVSKRYRIRTAEAHGDYGSLREDLANALAAPFRRLRGISSPKKEAFWALRNVSFEVPAGQIVGLIGANGAGKTTLLKILSRITRPTEGEVVLRGRVGSLLEIGAGFHAELTGRENIFLNGAILGMTRREITRRFEEIVEFAEVSRFLDTPVKRYSSGMYVRLAFAVAAHLEPEIMLIDEVLSVGDAAFQKKCLGKMSDVAAGGRTVLFVSHNMSAVRSLCERAVLLDHGTVVADGPPQDVIDTYLASGGEAVARIDWPEGGEPGNEFVKLHSVRLHPAGGGTLEEISMSTPLDVEIEFSHLKEGTDLDLKIQVCVDVTTIAFETSTTDSPATASRANRPGRYVSTCRIEGNLLRDGNHTLTLLVVRNQTDVVLKLENVLSFDVADEAERRGSWYGRRPGLVAPLLDWSVEPRDRDTAGGGGAS